MRLPDEPPTAFTADRSPRDVVSYRPIDAEALEAIHAALASHRPIVVTFPGEPGVDAEGVLGMSQPRIIHPGETEPVAGHWQFDDSSVDEEPTISPCE